MSDQDTTAKILNHLRFASKGMTITEISKKTGLNRNSIAKYLQMLLMSGQVDLQAVGNAKVYSISRRVPLTTLLSCAQDAILVLDTRGTILQVNERFLELVDNKRDQIVGMDAIQNNIPILSSGELKECLMRAFEGEECTYDVESENNGEILYHHAKFVPTVLEGGQKGLLVILEDITEKVISEEQLRISEERYRGIVEGQKEFICRFLPDGVHEFVNEAYCRYFGKGREEILNQRFHSNIPSEDRERLLEHLAALTPEEPSATIEHQIIMPDGQVRWQEWCDTAIFNDEGDTIEYMSVGRDITEKKRAEEAIRASEEQFRTITERSFDVIFMVDSTGNITYISPAIRRISAFDPSEIVGRSFRELLEDENDINEVNTVFSRLKEGKPIEGFELNMSKKDGSLIILEINATPLQKKGRFYGIQGVARDVTERIQSEQEIRDSWQKLQDIIEFFPDSVFVVDDEGTVIFWNHAMEGMTGIPKNEMLGKGDYLYAESFYQARRPMLLDVVSAPESEIRRLYPNVQREGNAFLVEASLQSRGKTRIYSGKAAPLFDEQGKQYGAIETIRDITTLREADRRLQESEERYRGIVEDQTELICRFTPEGRITFLNNAFRSYFSIDAEDGAGEMLSTRIFREDRSLFQSKLNEIDVKSPVTSFEIRVNRDSSSGASQKSMDQCWNFWTIRGIFDHHGSIFEYQVVGRDVTSIKAAEFSRSLYLKNTAFLAESAMDFMMVDSLVEVYPYIGRCLGEITPDAMYINVAEFDNRTHYGRVKFEEGEDIIGPLKRIAGKELKEIEFQFSEEVTSVLRDGKVVRIQGGFASLLQGVLPAETCARLENEVEIGDVFSIGLTSGNTVIGCVVILFPKGAELKDSHIIEAFIKQASIAIQKLWTEEHLMDSEAKYRELVENANSIILKLDTEGNIIFINEFAQKFFGFKEEEVRGHNVVGTLHPKAKSAERNLKEYILNISRYPEHFPTNLNEHITRDGKKVWVSWTNRSIHDSKGNIMGLLCIGNDITEQKIARDALRESEEKFRELFNNANDSLFLHEMTTEGMPGSFIEVNDISCRKLGYSREEMLGMAVPDIIADDFFGYLPDALNEVKTGGLSTFESVLVGRSGIYIPVEINSRLFSLGERDVVLSIARDISERKMIEERKRNYIRNLKFLSHTATDLVNLSPDRDIYQYIADELDSILPSALVMVTAFDRKSATFVIRSLAGSPDFRLFLNRAAGGDIIGMHLAFDQQLMRINLSGSLTPVAGGILKILEYQAEKKENARHPDDLPFLETYLIGLTWEHELFGSVLISLPQGTELDKHSVITTFINQASVAIQNRLAVQELRNAHDTLEKTVISKIKGINELKTALNLEILKRGHMDRSLREQNSLMVQLLYLLDLVIIITDAEGRIQMANDQAGALLDCTVPQGREKSVFEYLNPVEIREEIRSTMRNVVSKSKHSGVSLKPVIAADGEEKELIWHVRGIGDEHGRITSILILGEEPPGKKILALSREMSGEMLRFSG